MPGIATQLRYPHLRAISAQPPWISMTTALNAMSVPLNDCVGPRWGSMETHRVWTWGFCLTSATQGSTRRICTEGRECTNHHTRNRTSMICELQAPNASFPKGSMCAVKTRRLSARQAESLFALRVKPTVPEGDVLWPLPTVQDLSLAAPGLQQIWRLRDFSAKTFV